MLATEDKSETGEKIEARTRPVDPAQPVPHNVVPFQREAFSFDDEDTEDNRSFFRRYRVALLMVAIFALVAIYSIRLVAHSGPGPRKESTLVMVTLPPPPPPPPVQTAPPEKVDEQQAFQPEEKPEEEPPKPPDQPPIGTNIKGDGSSNGFNLGNNSGNGFGNNRANSTRFGWYAGQVQSRVSQALRDNRKTRTAELSVRAQIWPDATGRVTRAQLAGSSGDPNLDAAIRDEVLTGLQLAEPPPAGMPMPIVLRLTAKRPR
jgi:hypothetical protein